MSENAGMRMDPPRAVATCKGMDRFLDDASVARKPGRLPSARRLRRPDGVRDRGRSPDQNFRPPSRAPSASALTRPWYM